ncbi:MAG: lysophospholipid acyltransferase family protein [Myxococcaceae bacterium]|nr:lysophospholipid acyltransferase family protein [Myxococcaceae bacterium]
MAPLSKRLKRFVRYLLVRWVAFWVSLLPLRLASALGAWFGGVAFALAGKERRKALASLERAGLPAEVARDTFRHLGRAAFELVCVRQIDARFEDVVEWPAADRAVLDAALARGKGVVFVSAHLGNWELLARRVAHAGYPCHTIAKETTDPRLTRLVEAFRSSAKLQSIWRGRDGAARAMLRVLKGNGILGLLIDQDTDVQSVWVPFFGHAAKTPRAAADLALRMESAVVLGFCVRAPGEGVRYRLSMVEVPAEGLDAVALTAELTRRIEAAIRESPSQWVWMHQRWKSPIPPEAATPAPLAAASPPPRAPST